MMISPETIQSLKQMLDTFNPAHQIIEVDRTVLRALLCEMEHLQGGVCPAEGKKIDLIQKFTLEFAIHSMADSLVELSCHDWEGLTASDALMIAANRLREKPVGVKAHEA